MKKIFLSLVIFVATTAFADDRYQEAAERQFKQMSAAEAFASRDFNKQVANIYIPGTSSYVKGTNLCIEGNTIKSITPVVGSCVLWTTRNNNGDRITITNAAEAVRRDADCVERSSAYLSAPISYNAEIIVWGARNDDGVVKTYTSFNQASERGTPFVVETRLVSKSVPTRYDVNFYRYVAHDRFDNDHFVGKHTYAVSSCR